MGLQVIGSGFGRTGTLSLKHALQDLGFGPTYHMDEALRRPAHLRAWQQVTATGTTDWDALFTGFGSGVDFPVSCVWRELLAHHPDAKVIHTVRDPDRWWQSTMDTIYRGSDALPWWFTALIPPAARYVDVVDDMVWDGLFDGRFTDREHAIAVFERHTAEVIAEVPTNQLLVYEVSQGWEPLCAFLGVPVPDRSFPRLNDTKSMRRKLKAIHIGTRALPIAAAAGAVLAARRARRNGD